jgi:hypothetical protein
MADVKKPEMPAGEPEPTEEEIAESARLRDALEDPSLPHPDADLARALHAAFAPDAIDEEENLAIVADAMGPEIEAAAKLRDALADPSIASGDADLARALGAAWNPKALSDVEHRAIVDEALKGMKVVALRPRGNVVRVAFGVTVGALALAAGFLIVIRAPKTDAAPLARARSTQPLFSEPFKPGDASARIDKIAIARAGDFRDNRFAKWGVR